MIVSEQKQANDKTYPIKKVRPMVIADVTTKPTLNSMIQKNFNPSHPPLNKLCLEKMDIENIEEGLDESVHDTTVVFIKADER